MASRSRSLRLGIAIAVAAVGVATLLIYPLRSVSPAVSSGVVYLLAVLLVSTYWGLPLGLLTAVGSAATFNWFYLEPTGRFHVADSEHLVVLGVFLAAAVIASTVAGVARGRASEAERRRQEADLAAEMARILLGGATLDEATRQASGRLAESLGLPFATIALDGREPAPGEQGVPLGSARLLVPEGAQLGERIVASLEALLAAALDRERLQAEVVETQALRRSDVIKTALLRAVSHDLRSPLTAIITAGDAVRSPTMEAHEREDLGSLIVQEAARLSRLVEQLLDLSRLQAGTAEPRRDWCSIEEVVSSAVEHLQASDVPVEVAIDRDLPFVEADAAQLERVFVNLLENARRFSGGHPVKVRARDLGNRVAVRVVDRGPGIAEEEMPHIFEPFRQGNAQTDHPGSGLGLAIVKGLVEANGGRVYAESTPGQGTVFAIEFPLSEQPAAVQA
jgi:two-component system sensor histidine kinase KdpD